VLGSVGAAAGEHVAEAVDEAGLAGERRTNGFSTSRWSAASSSMTFPPCSIGAVLPPRSLSAGLRLPIVTADRRAGPAISTRLRKPTVTERKLTQNTGGLAA
jgi:hypothetical protein